MCRPYKVFRHKIGRPASEDVVVYEEPDEVGRARGRCLGLGMVHLVLLLGEVCT